MSAPESLFNSCPLRKHPGMSDHSVSLFSTPTVGHTFSDTQICLKGEEHLKTVSTLINHIQPALNMLHQSLICGSSSNVRISYACVRIMY